MQNKLLNMFDTKKTFSLPFISRQSEDNNVLLSAGDSTWKLGTKYKKIKYFVIGFQTHREDTYTNAARFDHCNLETIFVELNSERYPYECLRCNFAKEFKNSYYHYYPLFVIDVSKQNDRIKNSRPDITIKATFSKSIPADTKCYCLILSDSLVEINGDGLRVSVKNN